MITEVIKILWRKTGGFKFLLALGAGLLLSWVSDTLNTHPRKEALDVTKSKDNKS